MTTIMKRTDFEKALERSVENLVDDEQIGIEDAMLIDDALGGPDLFVMDEVEREYFLYGVEAGYNLGSGKSIISLLMEEDEQSVCPSTWHCAMRE